jgi:hypothetical protein
MEQSVTILGVEQKTTKTNKTMWTANTSAGKMSTFEKALADQLNLAIGKTLKVDVEVNGSFKNLKSILYIEEGVALQSAPVHIPKTDKTSSASMMIAYAKDLCVAGKIDIKDLGTKAKELLVLYEDMIK